MGLLLSSSITWRRRQWGHVRHRLQFPVLSYVNDMQFQLFRICLLPILDANPGQAISCTWNQKPIKIPDALRSIIFLLFSFRDDVVRCSCTNYQSREQLYQTWEKEERVLSYVELRYLIKYNDFCIHMPPTFWVIKQNYKCIFTLRKL